jgi:hypothetical protein
MEHTLNTAPATDIGGNSDYLMQNKRKTVPLQHALFAHVMQSVPNSPFSAGGKEALYDSGVTIQDQSHVGVRDSPNVNSDFDARVIRSMAPVTPADASYFRDFSTPLGAELRMGDLDDDTAVNCNVSAVPPHAAAYHNYSEASAAISTYRPSAQGSLLPLGSRRGSVQTGVPVGRRSSLQGSSLQMQLQHQHLQQHSVLYASNTTQDHAGMSRDEQTPMLSRRSSRTSATEASSAALAAAAMAAASQHSHYTAASAMRRASMGVPPSPPVKNCPPTPARQTHRRNRSNELDGSFDETHTPRVPGFGGQLRRQDSLGETKTLGEYVPSGAALQAPPPVGPDGTPVVKSFAAAGDLHSVNMFDLTGETPDRSSDNGDSPGQNFVVGKYASTPQTASPRRGLELSFGDDHWRRKCN